jgi:hypothetical protein
MHLGRHADSWRAFCELAGIELAVIDTELGAVRPHVSMSRANGAPAHADGAV